MFKRLLSILMITALIANSSFIAFAADIPTVFVDSVATKVSGVSKSSFKPNNNEVMTFEVDYNNEQLSEQLDKSSGSAKIKIGSTTIKSVASWTNGNFPSDLSWNGKSIDSTATAQALCGNTGNSCPDGQYELVIDMQSVVDSNTTLIDTEVVNFSIANQESLVIESFVVEPTGSNSIFDPAPEADDENLEISYRISETPNSVRIEITDEDNDILRTYTTTSEIQGSEIWDGTFANKIVEPGIYNVEITASKNGYSNVTSKQSIEVRYDDSRKSDIENLSVDPDTFDPDEEDALIEFRNDEEAEITIEIQKTNGDKVRSFESYSADDYEADDEHSLNWNGDDENDDRVNDGKYIVKIVTRNDYGVVVEEEEINVSDSGSSSSSQNSHISNINARPSSFDPSEDDEIVIEYDVRKDLDELQVFAVRGDEEIELMDDDNVEEDNDLELTWDGEDEDGDFVEEGTWRIEFRSTVGNIELEAYDTVNIRYRDPEIDEFLISKDEIDNDLGETAWIMFKIDIDAEVDIEILEDGRVDDEIEEDFEVEGDIWYAIEWDGDNYDYDDDIEIRLTAKNIVNEDIKSIEKIDFDLDEDETSNSKANITEDFISPVISDGDDEFEIGYYLEDDADVEITIHRGTSSTGSVVAELVDIENLESGSHSLIWNGREDDGSKLSNGFYTYKIVSRKTSTETETGTFVIGKTESSGSSSNFDNDDSGTTGKISPNVVIDGISGGNLNGNSGETCGGFSDVYSNSKYCDAVTWAKNAGIFGGYSDGTFKTNQAINRVELLKVILEANNIGINQDNLGTAGFSDVRSGEWYMSYIKTGMSMGIFNGDAGRSTARPGDSVNRVEALKFIFESLRVSQGYEASLCTTLPYRDVEFGSWYQRYLCEEVEYELFDEGVVDVFNPAGAASRGEIALALYRLEQTGL